VEARQVVSSSLHLRRQNITWSSVKTEEKCQSFRKCSKREEYRFKVKNLDKVQILINPFNLRRNSKLWMNIKFLFNNFVTDIKRMRKEG